MIFDLFHRPSISIDMTDDIVMIDDIVKYSGIFVCGGPKFVAFVDNPSPRIYIPMNVHVHVYTVKHLFSIF